MLYLAGSPNYNRFLFRENNVVLPVHNLDSSTKVLHIEIFYREKIQMVCERAMYLLAINQNGKAYTLHIHYSDICPELFCKDMQTSITEGYPFCENMDCPNRAACVYTKAEEINKKNGGQI